MRPRSKREYIEAILVGYKNASRKEKTLILNEFIPQVQLRRSPRQFKKGGVRNKGVSFALRSVYPLVATESEGYFSTSPAIHLVNRRME